MIRLLILVLAVFGLAVCAQPQPGEVRHAALEVACAQFWATKNHVHGHLGLLTNAELERLREINRSGTETCSETQVNPGASVKMILGYIDELVAIGTSGPVS